MTTQIQTISKLFSTIFGALLIVIPIMIILQWFFTDWIILKELFKPIAFFDPIMTTPEGNLHLVYILDHSFSLTEKWIGFIGTLIGLSPILLALIVLIPIFRNYGVNNIFSLNNAKRYQQLGYIFLYDSLLAKPICQALLTIAATLSNPPGQKQIMITFGMINVESLFCGAIIVIVARVMYLGHNLQEEQKFVI